MMAQAQAGLALLLALGLHLGAFATAPQPLAATARGDAGADLVSIEGATASIAEMVQAWDSPPPVTDTTAPAPRTPDASAPAPALRAAADRPPQATTLPQPTAPGSPEAMPQAQRDLPTPATRPKARPPVKAAPKPAPVTKPAAKPKPTSAGQTAQRAAGSGNGAMAGDRGTASAATLSKAQTASLTAQWGASIRARIERQKRHPGGARALSGTVTLRLTVTPAGGLAGVSVAASSGHAALDTAALRAVRSARFPAAPKGLTGPSYSFTLPMTFAR